MQTNREFRGAEDFRSVLKALSGPDLAVRGEAEARNAVLTKPAGSLGRLEDLAIWYAAVVDRLTMKKPKAAAESLPLRAKAV